MKINFFVGIIVVLCIAILAIIHLSGCSDWSKPIPETKGFLEYADKVKENSFWYGTIDSVQITGYYQNGLISSFRIVASKNGVYYHFTFRGYSSYTGKYNGYFHNPKPKYKTMELMLKYLKPGDIFSIASSKPLGYDAKKIYFRYIFLAGEKIPNV